MDIYWALILLMQLNSALAVIVVTKYGAVEGQSHTLHNGRTVNSFLGIPFAKPPTGELRWKPPRDPDPWTEVLKANKPGAACLQISKEVIQITHGDWQDYSEDCLFLNIYTPKGMSKGPYPVMVFFHGGSFSSGANFQFPGYFQASYDIISVVPNYRLHTMGFASTGDSVASGNYGLLDQQHALIFVRDNIRDFGGDPHKVTIAGHSAGGVGVGMQAVAPSSQGLFHQAIYQSGTDLAYWGLQPKASKPWTYTQQLAVAMNCTISDNKLMMDCLRTKPGETLMQFSPTCTKGYDCEGFGPVVDGDFLPEDPFMFRNSSQFTRVPTLSGIMEKDASLALSAMCGDLSGGITYKRFKQILHEDVVKYLYGEEHLIEDIYKAFRFYYTAWGQEKDSQVNRDQIIKAMTDLMYGFPSDLVLRDASLNSVAAFSYIMKYSSKTSGLDKWFGATHIMDMPYVFGMNFLKRNPSAWNESKYVYELIKYNEEDDKMADYMMTLWTNFVRTGHPTPTTVKSPSGEDTLWKPFTPNIQESFVIDLKPKHETRYRQRAYALFTQYLPYLNRIGGTQ